MIEQRCALHAGGDGRRGCRQGRHPAPCLRMSGAPAGVPIDPRAARDPETVATVSFAVESSGTSTRAAQ